MNKAVIIIPVLNPERELITYIKSLIKNGISKVIVVDDGSGEQYKDIFDVIAHIPQCDVLTHEVNKGKGRALKNAMKHYLEQGYGHEYSGVITVDADGQHAIPDVLKISEKMTAKSESLILGERAFDENVPWKSQFGNTCTRKVFRLFYGKKVSDTQTGLRGIPNSLISKFSDIEGERYEYEMNMLIMCSLKDIDIDSVVIKTIYIDDNASSHFHAVKDSFRIYKLLLGNFVKFTCASLASSVIDLVLFQILMVLLGTGYVNGILIATVGARIGSSLCNYLMNKNLVFKSQNSVKKTLVKYYALCVVQMLASAGLVTVIHGIFPVNATVIKACVDVGLFFVSHRVQEKYVF